MVGRFFPLNWRPPADEARFAREHGFDVIQIRSDRAGAIEDDLRTDLDEVRAAFAAAGVEPALEMLVRHEGEPGTIPRALAANLDAIARLGVSRVHVHPVGHPEVEALLADELTGGRLVASNGEAIREALGGRGGDRATARRPGAGGGVPFRGGPLDPRHRAGNGPVRRRDQVPAAPRPAGAPGPAAGRRGGRDDRHGV